VAPGLLPGYADGNDPAERARFEKAWGLSLPGEPGRGALDILRGIEEGRIKGLYAAGENPAATYPDSARVKKALSALDFLVVQDCFLTETASLAHVVLPAVSFAEKEGTFTNADRRVQRVRPAISPLGEARPDLWILQNLSREMGVSLGPASAREVNDEMRSLVPLYGGIDYSRLDSSGYAAGIQWPCPSPDHPGTSILYEKDFPRGKARLAFTQAGAGTPGPDSSLVLVTGPTMTHSGSLSTRSPGLLRVQGESFALVHPADARSQGLDEGHVVSLESPRGRIEVRVTISRKTAPGIIFVPAHFGENGGNRLTGWDLGITRVKLEKK
jgi:predicted molibdopterin-dependent oxidoreductase YjgC